MESESQETEAPSEGAQPQLEPAAAAAPPAAPRASVATVDTPIARPVPARGVLTRRLFILGGFWSTIALAFVGLTGPSLDFWWPRTVAGAARKVFVSADRVPKVGGDPVVIPEGRFFLVNLAAGTTPNGEETPGGLLAMWRKCPHLGCTVPWRPDFTFLGRTGWFRCPCHGSTYTREGGILVYGPAPRPLDLFTLEVQGDKSVVVTTGVTAAIKGGPENPSKTTPYDA
ncbi:MAG: ubiquinol-cytochrome c reductase iron-sulfur subunit [Dehalococcoidia bacterium]|nr:ubiquinol-cytochrome c reductase iron-sulfur subunit [Dehalococcoidia bacterium]